MWKSSQHPFAFPHPAASNIPAQQTKLSRSPSHKLFLPLHHWQRTTSTADRRHKQNRLSHRTAKWVFAADPYSEAVSWILLEITGIFPCDPETTTFKYIKAELANIPVTWDICKSWHLEPELDKAELRSLTSVQRVEIPRRSWLSMSEARLTSSNKLRQPLWTDFFFQWSNCDILEMQVTTQPGKSGMLSANTCWPRRKRPSTGSWRI